VQRCPKGKKSKTSAYRLRILGINEINSRGGERKGEEHSGA